MYGLVNKAIHDLVATNYGEATWEEIKTEAEEKELLERNENFANVLEKLLNSFGVDSAIEEEVEALEQLLNQYL